MIVVKGEYENNFLMNSHLINLFKITEYQMSKIKP